MRQTTSEGVKKRYFYEIKTLFPVLTKQERTFLQKMKEEINDTLSDESVKKPESIEDFYSLFGEPYDIVHQYLSEMGKDTFQNVLKLKKLKKCIYIIVTSLLAGLVLLFCVLLFIEHLNFMDTLPAYTTTEIVIIESEE